MAELARRPAFDASLTRPGVRVVPQTVGRRLLLTGDADVLAQALGMPGPLRAGEARALPNLGVGLWLRPDLWLLLADDASPGDDLARRLAGLRAWALDASARYAGVRVTGPRAALLLAGGCPLDFRERRFPIGTCAQSLIERVPAIIWRCAADAFEVMVERPLAHYFWRWLETVAAEFEEAGS